MDSKTFYKKIKGYENTLQILRGTTVIKLRNTDLGAAIVKTKPSSDVRMSGLI